MLYGGGMKSFIRPRRDFQFLERRRLHAGRLFAAGKSQADVARHLQVSRQSVSRWHDQWQRAGVKGLRAVGRAGRKPKLTAAQSTAVQTALRQGARAHGFRTGLWNLPRVAQLIERTCGVRYHPGHVGRILRSLGWTLQRPARRAKERDEAVIRQWVRCRWPTVKKAPAAAARG